MFLFLLFLPLLPFSPWNVFYSLYQGSHTHLCLLSHTITLVLYKGQGLKTKWPSQQATRNNISDHKAKIVNGRQTKYQKLSCLNTKLLFYTTSWSHFKGCCRLNPAMKYHKKSMPPAIHQYPKQYTISLKWNCTNNCKKKIFYHAWK